MKPSLRALLEHLIDYAGLFPPAKLDMTATVRNYAEFLAGDHSWMLGRVIVPVPRLDEFEAEAGALLPRDDDADPWHLSALTGPAGSDQLAGHLQRISEFNTLHADPARGAAVIDVIELKGTEADTIDETLDVIPDDLFPFFELPVTEDPRGLVSALVGSDAGAKVRTGGVTADLYPRAADLARFIAACAGADVPFKATAGLHHPLYHHVEAIGADEFGFLNVFLAATVATYEDPDPAELAELLVESDLGAFGVEDDVITWRDYRLATDQLEDTRLAFAVSFGSCSFDEPREDLAALGLMP